MYAWMHVCDVCVEAKLQELFWWCQGISKIIKDEFQGWRKQDVKQKQRSQDKN